ncbi:Crp/Fnr family transcriptional regulator [Latilactobacillus sakei]|uniref:Crp/Fnr family transcriptional regulator n=1 Tax=Latilactobacillus sakei TaxID=1599 RepID=UPI00345CD112
MIAADEYPRYIQYLRTRPEFIDFSDEEMNILMNNMKVKDFHKGQELFDQTDERSRFYFVVSGLVRAERTDESDEFTFYTYIKQNLAFPYRGMFTDQYYPYTARAMTDIEIIYFPMATFEHLLQKNTGSIVKVVQEMGSIISESEDQIQRMVTSSAKQRVIQALKIFEINLGEPLRCGRSYIPYPITVKELATMSGTTRETAGQIVKQLAAQKLLSYEHKEFRFEKAFFKDDLA